MIYDYELYRDYAFILLDEVFYKADLHFEAALDILELKDANFNREDYFHKGDIELIGMTGDDIVTGEKATINGVEMIILYTEKSKNKFLQRNTQNDLPVYTEQEVESKFICA